MEELLDLAVRAARLAGDELRKRHGNVQGLAYKSSATDPVSDADRAAEQVLVETLLGARPADGVLGEEGSDRPGGSGLRWVIDPLDGTVNYLYGRRHWSVSVAAEDEHGLLVAVVHDPGVEETFTAVRGGGAALDGRPLRVNDPVSLDRALLSTGYSYDAERRRRQAELAARLAPQVQDYRRTGSAALDLCEVASGRIDAFYEDELGPWDRAAGTLVVREAGGVVTDLPLPEGAKPGNVGVVAAGPHLHDLLRPLLLNG